MLLSRFLVTSKSEIQGELSHPYASEPASAPVFDFFF